MTRPYIPRKPFHVVVYSTANEVVGDSVIKARSVSQAAADGWLNAHLNHTIDRVTVDDITVVENGTFIEGGKGRHRAGNSNVWYRLPIELIRTLKRILPDKSKSWFVADAVREKLARESEAIRTHASKYQK